MPPRINLKTAIVTGASSGIGRELVRQLAGHKLLPDLNIIATARRLERLEELANCFPAGRVIPFAADLARPEDRHALMEFARQQSGSLDLLINNAGFGTYCKFENSDLPTIQAILAVDVEAVLDLTAQALAWMKPVGRGQIVQISSILGEVGLPYSATYVAAKHAINGLVKSLRPELAGTGVKVWAACPGRTESEFRQIAGKGQSSTRGEYADPTEKVVAAMVKAILRGEKKAFFYPAWKPWTIAHIAWLCPALWDWIMTRYGQKIASEDLAE